MGQARVVKPRSPEGWATDISVVLNTVLGPDRFPISVTDVALELSRKWFPDDPLSLVQSTALPGFDGALLPAPPGQKGWGIFYNSAVTSKGRINFTLAHEFGHYLIHRLAFPDGIRCSQQDMWRWDSAYKKIENEANTFAAYLLMPFGDYRRQINPQDVATFDLLGECAERYEVSLIAATLRWLAFTERRAVLVLSRDGFILWARSSESALKSGAYIKTSGLVVPVPEKSVAARPAAFADARAGVDLPSGVWFREGCREMGVVSENYDFTISLINLEPATNRRFEADDEAEPETLDARIRRRHGL
jgi:hypothetical protein